MRIGIDAQILSWERRGIGKYVYNLVQGLAKADQENSYTVYCPPAAFPHLSDRPNFILRPVRPWPSPVWEQCFLPLLARKDGLDLLHCPANTAPLYLTTRIKLVISVHDVMYLLPLSLVPQVRTFRQRVGKVYRRTVVPRVVGRADCILTVSECSRADILKYLPVGPEKVRVVYEGVDPSFEDTPGLPVSSSRPAAIPPNTPFILGLGAHDPRKNTEALIRIYADSRRNGGIREKLVMVGVTHWKSSSFWRLASELGLTDDVIFTDYISDEELAWLYRAARCLLYLPTYEGFGFPPIEAMACGTPVIASAVGSIPEVTGGAAMLVDPNSPEAVRTALMKVLHDSALRRVLIEKGRTRAAEFTWESAVLKTLGVYKDLLRMSTRNR